MQGPPQFQRAAREARICLIICCAEVEQRIRPAGLRKILIYRRYVDGPNAVMGASVDRYRSLSREDTVLLTDTLLLSTPAYTCAAPSLPRRPAANLGAIILSENFVRAFQGPPGTGGGGSLRNGTQLPRRGKTGHDSARTRTESETTIRCASPDIRSCSTRRLFNTR